LAPERATLALSRQEHGEWQIVDILAACNQRVSQATARVVNEWFHGSNRSPVERLRKDLNMKCLIEVDFKYFGDPLLDDPFEIVDLNKVVAPNKKTHRTKQPLIC
jgi:hypothetical protein